MDVTAQAMAKVGDTPLNRRGAALAGAMLSAMMSGAVGLDTAVPVEHQIGELASRLAAGVKPSLLAKPESASPKEKKEATEGASSAPAPVAAEQIKVEEVKKGGCCVVQ